MNKQALRASILQLASQGKLVEQRENEGTAEDLIKQIESEREQLVNNKVIRKQSTLEEIDEENNPFDIPDNWKWVKLGNIISVFGGKRIPVGRKLSEIDTGYKYIRVSDMKDGSVHLGDIKYVPIDVYEQIKKYTISSEDVYITVAGTIGRVGLIPEELHLANLTENANKLIVFSNDKHFIYFLLSSNVVQRQIREVTTKVGQPKLAIKRIRNLMLPLPPVEEQKRIVTKIEELIPLVEQYGDAHTEVKKLNEQFPAEMEKSILQYAIQGKLVEQRPEEGTAEELYTQIQEEKQELVESGKIRKQKKLPEIMEEEIPFDIPDSWKWVRLGNIGEWGAGSTPRRSNAEYYGGEIPWLKTGDLTDGDINSVSEFITHKALEETSIRLNPVGSVLIAMYGATIGKLGVLNIEATTNQACCACVPFNGVYNMYLFYYLLGQRNYFIKMGSGGAQPNISRTKIINSLIPLPPLEEQERIVKRIEELLPYTKQLIK